MPSRVVGDVDPAGRALNHVAGGIDSQVMDIGLRPAGTGDAGAAEAVLQDRPPFRLSATIAPARLDWPTATQFTAVGQATAFSDPAEPGTLASRQPPDPFWR